MSARTFPFAMIERDGARHSALRIDCDICNVQAFFKTPRGGHKDAIVCAPTETHWRNVGWLIGSRAKGDRCPSCLARDAGVMVAAVEPPRTMSREDRRIVFAKIDELYLDDKSGYSAPWTDSAVARDLGVPRAWVAQVRDELFGPEGSNAEFDEFLANAAPIITDLKNLLRSVHAQLDEARKIAERVDSLERTAKRIEREIGKAS